MDASKSRYFCNSMQGDHYSRDTIYIRDDSSSDVNSSRRASISWKISNSRETSNMQQRHLMLDARCQKQ